MENLFFCQLERIVSSMLNNHFSLPSVLNVAV